MSTDIAQMDDKRLAQLANQQANIDDGFSSDDVAIPNIKLIQGLSDEVSEGIAPGTFYHTGAGEELGDSFEFIICSRRKRYILMPPMNAVVDGGTTTGLLAQANDGKTWDVTGKWEIQVDKKTRLTWEIKDRDVRASGLADWGSSDPEDPQSPPAATLLYEYVVLLPGHYDWGPAVMLLTRTALKRARKGLNDKILMHQNNGRPMQSLIFNAAVTEDSAGANQDYFNWRFNGAGFVNDMDIINRAIKLQQSVSSMNIDVGATQGSEKVAESDDF